MERTEQIQQRVEEAVSSAVDEFNGLGLTSTKLKFDTSKPLLDQEALDSMSLVHFIVAVEEKIREQFDLQVDLSSDAAFSKERTPFATMRTLIDFITERVNSKWKEAH